jgi:hypothetical protein
LEDFHFTEENRQNCGWWTTQNLLRSLFKQWVILRVPCQYILSLRKFIINNQDFFFKQNNINTRNKHYLNRLNTNLSRFQKCTFYSGINIFSSLPPSVTVLKNDEVKFKAALRKFLHRHCLYSIDEFFCVKMIYMILIL